MNARDFVISLAEQLTAQGRDVEVHEDEEMIRIFSNSRNILETAIGAGAYKRSRTGRWTFLGIRAYPLMGDEIKEQTRRNAEIIVSVYGRSYLREEVIEVVQDHVGDKTLTLARCRSCGFVGGHAINDQALTLAVAKRHGKTCPELKNDEVDDRLIDALTKREKGISA